MPTALRSRRRLVRIDRLGRRDDRVGPGLVTTVAGLNGHVLVNLLGVLLQRLVDGFLDLLIELGLIRLDGQDVVAFALADLVGDLPLAAHRVDRDQGPADLQ